MKTELMRMPELDVKVEGSVTKSNITEYKDLVTTFISNINYELEEDEHFAQAEIDIKSLKAGEVAIKQEREKIINQTSDISSLLATLDTLGKDISSARKSLDKQVKDQKDSVKVKLMTNASNRVTNYLAKCEEETRKEFNLSIPYTKPDFFLVIKGLRTVETTKAALKKAADLACESIKISHENIMQKIEWMKKEPGVMKHKFLFTDIVDIIEGDFQGFKAIIGLRINEHKEKERKKEEQIKAKAEADARAKVTAELAAKAQAKADREAEEEAKAKSKAEVTSSKPKETLTEKGVSETTNLRTEEAKKNLPDEPAPPVLHTRSVTKKEAIRDARADCEKFMARYMNLDETDPIRNEMVDFLERTDWAEE